MTRSATHRVLTFVVAAGLFGALTAARVEAQRFGRLPRPRAGACFFRDAYFRGDYSVSGLATPSPRCRTT